MAEENQQTLLSPTVNTIRKDDLIRQQMERTISMDIREEREDLKEAAEQSLNVILDLGLDGTVRWISPSWKDVIGTPLESIQGKRIADVIVENKNAFEEAVESMKQDDSRSQLIRFAVILGPLSVLKQGQSNTDFPFEQDNQGQGENSENVEVINLEGQGIMVYDRSSGGESHTMWMIRPTPQPREVTIDLPELLVGALGVGAEMLAHYLTTLAEVGANDPANHPPPLPVLCRICERHITPWWFEKHSELCLQEHRAEMEVQLAQEALAEHRPAIVKVLDALEARKSRPTSGDLTGMPLPQPEYKGLPIGPSASPSSSSSGSPSGRTSPVTPPRTRETSSTGLGHARAKSFAVRRPLSRIVELILDLCDTAMSINAAAIKELKAQANGEFRSQSPNSESGISQVLAWQTPGSSSTLEQEHGLAMLNADTEAVARAKVESVLRHRRIIEYSERIRVEFDMHVRDCIDVAMRKAARIAAGQLSDSSTDAEEEDGDLNPEQEDSFTGSYDGPSPFDSAIRSVSDPALALKLERSRSFIAITSRSDSPLECPTPRSTTQASGITGQSQPQSKRVSMFLGSDAGDSDSSLPFPSFTGKTRTEPPGSERALGRSASSRERKRKSLKLPRMPSPRRQQSPVRPGQPSSPLRSTKSRMVSGGQEHMPSSSPVTSPSIPTTEFASPTISAQNHRRQSSTALSGDVLKPPASPRLASSSYPQARAVAPSIKDFEIIKPISKGAFGSVYLSKKKSTGDYFAIKVLKKADMVAKNQVTNVKAERAIMMWQGESDFVAKLYWTFSSKDYLYLVMEYLNGGDCASLVKVLGGLSEDWAKKYLAEVVLGVEHLHSRGIVHRDLKPDNLLIDQKGHLKLTDFGLSRMGLIGRQKRVLKSPHETTPDLLKHGPFVRASSMASSRSASFDMQGCHSPTSTPIMTPDLAGQYGQPSYFNLRGDDSLGRESSRRASGYRSDSGGSDAFNAMFKNFSLNDDSFPKDYHMDEETQSESGSPDPYPLHSSVSHSHIGQHNTPPPSSMLPPPMALFDPDDLNRRFVGTPDYLAPETINGLGQDENSDWWSLGCIMFEFLFGYPPFHAETPDKVFENILERRIMWPEEDECEVSQDAKDLMNKLMTINPKERLGANMHEQFKCGGEEIRKHPWFDSINWETLLEDEARFVPAPENPEDTEYFDARGASLQAFAEELEDQMASPVATPGAEYAERPHDALSRVRSQVNSHSMKRSLIPLHIPAHVRDGRNRKLSEPFVNDDFGSFAFKNLPVLERANKDVIQKLRAEAMHAQTKVSTPSPIAPSNSSPAPVLEGSPLLPMPLKRTLSTSKGNNRPASPSNLGQSNQSPIRGSQPSSPLLVSFSTGQNHDRRKASSASSTLSHPSSSSLQPGSFFEVPVPRLPNSFSFSNSASSPIKTARAPTTIHMASPDKGMTIHRTSSIPTSRARSQTLGSQDGDLPPVRPIGHHKRRSQVFDISPSSSDNEDPRAKALLRVQRRRQSSRRMSQFNLGDGPVFRPLDVLICEDHPVSRHVMERLLEKLRCRTITVSNGAEAMRYAMSEVQFDIIMMEFKLPQINGADVARMIRDTKSANTQTPIIAVTGYLKELPQTHHFDSLIEKPPTLEKLQAALTNLCQWRPPPEGYTFLQPPQNIPHSSLRMESRRSEDSPSSLSSGPFAHMPGTSYGRSSREDSISSSFFGDASSTTTDDAPVIVSGQSAQDWAGSGLGISEASPVDSKPFFHPGLPHLLHHNSAPPAVHFRTARTQRSIEAMRAKRESMEQNRHECGESGDDEDDELGRAQTRTRSPPATKRSGSKLGTEMMRTNSRGSVTSTSEEVLRKEAGLMTPVPESGSESSGPYRGPLHHSTITPPEIFPKEAGEAVKVIDMDATPKSQSAQPQGLGTDPPTPRRPASPLSL